VALPFPVSAAEDRQSPAIPVKLVYPAVRDAVTAYTYPPRPAAWAPVSP